VNNRWPDSLLTSSVYPHSVDTLQLIETHISWVVLTGQFAYKIKKPVDLGFLDFTTLALRRHYCERELALNRRFSRDLYLDVVPVNGTRENPRVQGGGEIIDYAVKMRQFDNRLRADHLAESGQLGDDLVRLMGRTLARIHRSAPAIDPRSEVGAVAAFSASAMQNFTQIDAYNLADDLRQTLADQKKWVSRVYQNLRQLMEKRREQGFVKDCHGDCHLGNIVILEGEIILFDCIEFNDSFRITDTLAEAALLGMDLWAHGLREQFWRFLNSYLEFGGDYEALALLDLYGCYYALVRAKVDLLKTPAAAQPLVSPESRPEFYRYIALAGQFTAHRSPALILMHGFSGSGKSWLAEQLATRIGAIRIRSDVERKRIFRLEPDQACAPETDLYSEKASQLTLDRMIALAHAITDAGYICIVDATFLTLTSRAPFFDWAAGGGIPLAILHCEAAEQIILRRLQQRSARARDPSDADSLVYRRQKETAEPLSDRERRYMISVDTGRADCIDFAYRQLAQEFS